MNIFNLINLGHNIRANFLLFVENLCNKLFAQDVIVFDLRLRKLWAYYYSFTLGLSVFSLSAHNSLKSEIIDFNGCVLYFLKRLFTLVIIIERCPSESLKVMVYYRSAHRQMDESGYVFLLEAANDVRSFNLDWYISQKQGLIIWIECKVRCFLKVEILAIEVCVLNIWLLLHVYFLIRTILLVQLIEYRIQEFVSLEPSILIMLIPPEEYFTRIIFLDKPWFVLMIVVKRVFLLLFVLVDIVFVSLV